MKRTSWTAALLLTILLIVGFGCATKDESSNPAGGVGSVQVVLDRDTLEFIPGDSAAVHGFVVVVDREGRVMPGVKVTISLSPVIGLIEWEDLTLKDTTNALGRVGFYFRSYAQPGNTVITAVANNVTGVAPLTVRAASNFIASLTISLSKSDLRVSPSFEDSARVTVTIKDSSSMGIAGISLVLSATGGRLRPLPATDSTGRAETWWYNNREYGTFVITVRAAGLSASASINVQQLPDVRGTLRVTTSTPVIQADNCVTRATITATLRDQYSTAVVGDTIIFSAPAIGQVTARAVTDSFGIAQVPFCSWDEYSANPFDSALVVARHDRWNLIDTVRVLVLEAATVTRVDISANRTQGIAGVDSASITVHAYYADNVPVNGLKAFFGSTCGMFSLDTVTLFNGTHSSTPVSWRFCSQTTDAQFRALVWATVGGVTSDTLSMDVNPGPARWVDLEPSSFVILMTEQLSLTALVTDSLGNAVRGGVPVTFTSTRGTLSPHQPVSTDNFGIARATLTPATEAGQVIVKATIGGIYSDSAVVTILSGLASTIQLSTSYSSPQVEGTGGISWTQVYADVYDANGNPVQDGHWVYFEILDSPGQGCSINGRGLSDSAQTAAGRAAVTFRAGRRPGPVTIQACTHVLDSLICVRASNITIVAGPPAAITIQPNDVGVDADGVAWDVSVGALVGDMYNNPVRNGIAVFFELTPEIALILSDTVTTGNGPHRPGIAYTTIRYPSDVTFQHVLITARTAGPNPVMTQFDYILPLQNPTISLNCIPATWHYGVQGDPCRIRCITLVRDGHNRLINGATVIFAITRGRFYTTETGNVQQNYQISGPYSGPSGPPHSPAGHAELWMRELAQYIFPPMVNEITADVQVEVQGYSAAIDGQTINLRQ